MALPNDRLDFYGADLGPALDLDLSTTSAASVKLAPGRWLVQLIEQGANVAWVRVGAYSASSPLVATADVPATPMQTGGLLAFELNVRGGVNDQIVGIMASDTARLILTPIGVRNARIR